MRLPLPRRPATLAPVTVTLEQIWPAFGLLVEAGPLTLRAMRDGDLPVLAEAAASGIHADDLRPFPNAWASGDAVKLGRDLGGRYWKYRATLGSDEWALPLVARWNGRVVGVQGAEAARYPVLRTPDTFSWLTRDVQGQGIGTLMRQAVCALFFDELDAHQVTSGAYADNPASAAVSRKVGYAPNGTKLELRDNTAALHHKFILDREGFIRPKTPIKITGASGVRTLLGVARPTDS